MSWPCKLIEFKKGMHPRNGTLKVGDMFYGPYPDECNDDDWGILRTYVRHLSAYYKVYNSHRRPLFVVLPGLTLFCLDQQCVKDGKWHDGWSVKGEAPRVTVTPAINLQGLFHGWLRSGMIMPDCEGRIFGEDGREIK